MQREPSMEEILASIRRIIEDSDTTRDAPPEQLEANVANEAEQGSAPEVEPETADLVEVGRFQGAIEEDVVAGEPAAPSDRTTETDIEMRSQAANIQPFPAPPAAAARQTAPGSAPLDIAGDADKEANRALPLNGRDAPSHAPQPTGLAEPQSGDHVGTGSPQAIISERAGRQVAAAFEELSEAFAANRRRSFDEMAEEMLRPMLREWMDNNLPLLVERLVREEIERVARGN